MRSPDVGKHSTARVIAIYALVDWCCPDLGAVPIYIGQTNDPARRFRQHVGAHCHSRLLAWRIANSAQRNDCILPEMRVIEWVGPEEANRRELYWLAFVRQLGWSPANRGPWNRLDLEEMAAEMIN